MITGELKSKIDKIWNDMFSYGMSNPLVVIEQLTYLFFIKSLDDMETDNEKAAAIFGTDFTRIFPADAAGQEMRWSVFQPQNKSLPCRSEESIKIRRISPNENTRHPKPMRMGFQSKIIIS